jgi:DegV family protein with EDD domain
MTERPAFAVVTDSTADIPGPMAEERGIAVVPLTVSIGSDTLHDGEISQAEFFDRMAREPRLPSTSQPPVGAFVDAYTAALEHANDVISIHISNKLSGTIESARQAADRFAGRVHVFDSLNLSWGLAWQVVDAATAALEGASIPDALARLGRARDRVRLIVGLDSLDNLAKGGRIGRVGAFLGGLLSVKVTFTVDKNGEFKPLGRSRGEKAALEYTLEWVDQQMGGQRRGSFAVGHAMSRERARWLADELSSRYEVDQLVMYEAGSVISAHTGTGWGIAVFPSE